MNYNKLANGAIGVLAVLTAAVLGGYTSELRSRTERLSLRLYNDSAALDSSRAVALSRRDSIRILGDSLRAVTRLAIQEHQRSDALDKAMHVERRASVGLVVRVDTLHVAALPSIDTVLVDTGGVRRVTWHVETEAYRADAKAAVPRSGPGSLDLDVRVSPATLGVRIGCEKANRDGVPPARVTVTGPTWLTVTIQHAEQDPAVCRPALAAGSWWRAFRPQVGLGVGWSIVRRPDGTLVSGKSLHAGVTLWHWPR